MDMKTIPRADAAELVLPAADFDATLKFFTERLGFRLDAIFPADDPATALVSGHGWNAAAPVPAARCACWHATPPPWRARSAAARRR